MSFFYINTEMNGSVLTLAKVSNSSMTILVGLFSVMEDKKGILEERRQLQVQLESMAANQTSFASNLTSLASNVEKLGVDVSCSAP